MTKIVYVLLAGAFLSCTEKKQPQTVSAVASVTRIAAPVENILQTCYACHNPKSESHDSIIAPPLAGIKRRYLMSYPDSISFVNAMASWIANPDSSRVLMRGALMQFGLMPPQLFTDSSLKATAAYIYASELPKPAWFDTHERGRMMGN